MLLTFPSDKERRQFYLKSRKFLLSGLKDNENYFEHLNRRESQDLVFASRKNLTLYIQQTFYLAKDLIVSFKDLDLDSERIECLLTILEKSKQTFSHKDYLWAIVQLVKQLENYLGLEDEPDFSFASYFEQKHFDA